MAQLQVGLAYRFVESLLITANVAFWCVIAGLAYLQNIVAIRWVLVFKLAATYLLPVYSRAAAQEMVCLMPGITAEL